uniref:F-box domain-containing protein n=1 Tax=Cacopsylla melanoneura TaxID=428564 RepID=A0A8D9EPE5_9HEMI
MNARNMFDIDCESIIKTEHEIANNKTQNDNNLNISDNLYSYEVVQLAVKEADNTLKYELTHDSSEVVIDNENVPPDECWTNRASLHWLPTEMIEAILDYLSPVDTLSCSTACLEWHKLLDNATIWRAYCEQNRWKLLTQLCEPCPLNSDLDLSQFSLWKQSFLIYSRIKNNWMEGNSLHRIERLDSTYTNVIANSNIIITWFFIQNIKIYKIINHHVISWQILQPVLKRRPIESIIISEQRNGFVVIQYGLLQYYEEVEDTKKRRNKSKCDTGSGQSTLGEEMTTKIVLKFVKSFDVDERNIELCKRKINDEFQEWYERNVIRCNVNLNVKFNHGNLLFVCELERKNLYVWNLNTAERKAVINLGQTVHKLYSKANPAVLNFKLNKNKIFVSIQISNTVYLILVFCQKTFNLIEQTKVNNALYDFHVNNDYLVLDMMDNIRYIQIWDTHSFTVLTKKCKIVGDNEKLGSILLVDSEVMFHRDNSVIIYDIKRKQCSTYPTYKIGNITNIILAPFNLFIIEYHMSDRKYNYCLYDRVTYRWIVKKFIMSFQRKPQILFKNLNSIIIKEFNLVHYFTFW